MELDFEDIHFIVEGDAIFSLEVSRWGTGGHQGRAKEYATN